MAKAIFTLPILHREDYDAFRRDLGADLADTYDKWMEFYAEQRDQAIKRGERVIDVQVNHHEFIRFCRSTGAQPDLKLLLEFADRKAIPL
jgi:hypothetical protein